MEKLIRDLKQSTRREKEFYQEKRAEIDQEQKKMKYVQMDTKYVPNTKDHQITWTKKYKDNCFSSTIEQEDVEKIVNLDIDIKWKLLLLMGIGSFSDNIKNTEYLEIMKKLSHQRSLFMIIASTDYIYGTNYQFYHQYIGKDLLGISQEKLIQAMGRVGRQDSSAIYTLRFRDDQIIDTILQKQTNTIEIDNMNKLFT